MKNIKLLNDKPLIAYTIEAAIKSGLCDDVVVTTDDEQIADVAKQYGASVPFLRPAALAGDHSKTVDAVIHSIRELEMDGKIFDILVLLQPTSPLRTHEDIKSAMEVFVANGMGSVVSVHEISQSPLLIRSLNSNGELKSIMNANSTVRRQDQGSYYIVNGAIYINQISKLNPNTSFNDNEYGYIMPQERAVDIDTWDDFNLAARRLMSS